jgi:hypothetical protein
MAYIVIRVWFFTAALPVDKDVADRIQLEELAYSPVRILK